MSESKIAKYRKEMSLTQQELSSVTGIPRSYISLIENGKATPSDAQLSLIASTLNVPPSALNEDDKTDPINKLINTIISLTKKNIIRWNNEYEDIHHNPSPMDGISALVPEGIELKCEFYSVDLDCDTYYLLQDCNDIIYFSATDQNAEVSYIVNNEENSNVNLLYESAKLSAQGKNAIFDFLKRAEDFGESSSSSNEKDND